MAPETQKTTEQATEQTTRQAGERAGEGSGAEHPGAAGVEIVTGSLGDPDARALDELVQAEYTVRYGSPDSTPMDAAMFAPPRGLFLLAYDARGTPVASGGWRAQEDPEERYAPGDAEIKRMFVIEQARGRGLARLLLARLEESARRAGRRRMVLETGLMQPEAMGLYESSGYRQLSSEERFGIYRHTDVSRCYVKLLQGGQPR